MGVRVGGVWEWGLGCIGVGVGGVWEWGLGVYGSEGWGYMGVGVGGVWEWGLGVKKQLKSHRMNNLIDLLLKAQSNMRGDL